MREIPALLNDLREGFASVSFDVRKTDHLLKELQKCHIAALRGMAMTPAAESSDDVMSDVDGLEADVATLAQAESFPVGGWIEFSSEDGRLCRAKLAWRSEITDLLLFSNRRGRKVMELTHRGFALKMADGRIRPLAGFERPLLDRALMAVAEVLDAPAQTEQLRPHPAF
jgi:hypothetical protein